MSHTLEELRSVSDDEIVLHDHHARNASAGVNFYLTELARRDADRQGERMVALTAEIRTLTGSIESATRTIRLLTIANVVPVAISLVLIAKEAFRWTLPA